MSLNQPHRGKKGETGQGISKPPLAAKPVTRASGCFDIRLLFEGCQVDTALTVRTHLFTCDKRSGASTGRIRKGLLEEWQRFTVTHLFSTIERSGRPRNSHTRLIVQR